jgi:hypothetical protein
LSLPTTIIAVLVHFEPLFCAPTWQSALVLVVGTLLGRGRRTVTAALRVMGYRHDPHWTRFHQVLNRAHWSPLAVSHRLLLLIVARLLPPTGPVTLVIDEHLERRWGPHITHRSHYRDPVRSSATQAVSSSGLRWLVVAVVVQVPWTSRQWALPFLTILTHAPAVDAAHGGRHKTLAAWTMQVVKLVRRWLPERELHLLGDSSYCVLDLAAICAGQGVTLITPLHLDAMLYAPAPPPTGRRGRPRKVGLALPKLAAVLVDPTTRWCRQTVSWYAQGVREVEWCSGAAVWYRGGKPPVAVRWVLVRDPAGHRAVRAYLCTAPGWAAATILTTYQGRWTIEVTFEESRAHLGVETQRQWSDLAIARSTPGILGLYSVVALVGQALHPEGQVPIAQAAWYPKAQATFSDVLASVRLHLWEALHILQAAPDPACVIIRRTHLDRLVQAAAAT